MGNGDASTFDMGNRDASIFDMGNRDASIFDMGNACSFAVGSLLGDPAEMDKI